MVKNQQVGQEIAPQATTILKIASVLDWISYLCFKPECALYQLKASDWKSVLHWVKPHFLLVESAWNKDYQKLFSTCYNYGSTSELLKWCRKWKIPTVYWSKEDPVHFEFNIKTARHFDYIFTTDSNCITKYRQLAGADRVFLLPFAAQPKIHNPIDKDQDKLGKVAFSGTWYPQHLKRQLDMEMLLKPALKYNLAIYDRMYHLGDESYKFPEIYRQNIRGFLSYEEMVLFYKKYDLFLNVNTVNDSPTMFSRRVFELLACGTNVISSYALGIAKFFPGIVKLCKTAAEVADYLKMFDSDSESTDRLSLLGQRAVFTNHTYTHRLNFILKKIGQTQFIKPAPGVSMVCILKHPAHLSEVLHNFKRQQYPKKELIIGIPDNHQNPMLLLNEDQFSQSGQVVTIKVPLKNPLDFLLNLLNYDYLTLVNEADYYGPNYVSDLLNSFQYTGCSAVGKYSHFVYLKNTDSLFIYEPGFEYRYVDCLDQSTLMFRKNDLQKLIFEDVANLSNETFFDINSSRIKLFSTDRFNYLRILDTCPENFPLGKNLKTVNICCSLTESLQYITV